MVGSKETPPTLFARYFGGGRVSMLALALVTAGVLAACGGGGEPPTPPTVSFHQPTNNAIVPPTFTVIMGVDEGFVVEPAGEVRGGAGHFHILIDTDLIEAGEDIPDDEQHLHFDDGSTEAEITLSPGTHVLRLQFADGNNRALAINERGRLREIFVTAAEDAPAQGVRFVSPTDGATVPPTFDVLMSATGLVVEPPADIQEGVGHLHILVDTNFIPAGAVIPSGEEDEQHIHLQDGSTGASILLSPGSHTLRLQFANSLDSALQGDQYRDEITVNVEFGRGAQQVMFAEPLDGDTVPETFTVKTAAVGIPVEPAGVVREGAGHMHILVNEDFVLEVIPRDETHIHLDEGQLSTELSLEPGTYSLRLQMANGSQQAIEGDQYRDAITITVE
jgi:hypothetical protein